MFILVYHDPDHDYLYLISELGNLGAVMEYKNDGKFFRNQKIIDAVFKKLNMELVNNLAKNIQIELAAVLIF